MCVSGCVSVCVCALIPSQQTLRALQACPHTQMAGVSPAPVTPRAPEHIDAERTHISRSAPIKRRCQRAVFMKLRRCLPLPSDAGKGSVTHKHRGSLAETGAFSQRGAQAAVPARKGREWECIQLLSVPPGPLAGPSLECEHGRASRFLRMLSTGRCGEELMGITGRVREITVLPTLHLCGV